MKVQKIIVLLTFLLIGADLSVSAQTYAYGNYTGNGVSKTITGLGFSPEAIIIKSNGAYEAVFTTANMPAGKTKQLGTGSVALITGEVTSLNADGFTLGAGDRANKVNVQYNWIAFNESTNIHIGTYTGGSADMSVTGVGFQAEAFLLCGDVASSHGDAGFITAYWVTNGNEGFLTRTTSTTAGANYINIWGADGWSIQNSTGTTPSFNGTNYYYIAFNESGTTIKENYYTANNSATDYAITDPGFKPDFLIVKQQTATPVFRVAAYPDATDKTLFFTATAATTGHIKSLDAGAGFTGAAGSTSALVANQDHIYLLCREVLLYRFR
jgi:hypothetical protein